MITAEEARELKERGRIAYLTEINLKKIENKIRGRAGNGSDRYVVSFEPYEQIKCVPAVVEELLDAGFKIKKYTTFGGDINVEIYW